MEKELLNEFTAEVELVAGGGGIFEVVVDGQEIFSKQQERRFPNPGEISEIITKGNF